MRFLLAILALILSTLSVDAKRGAKPIPKTTTFGDVEFITSSEECGIVLVKRSTAPHKLEKQRVYRVRYHPFKERDVQDVWIADMFTTGDTLWIRDELNRIYSMTIKTFSVSERKDVSIDDLQRLKRKTSANPQSTGANRWGCSAGHAFRALNPSSRLDAHSRPSGASA